MSALLMCQLVALFLLGAGLYGLVFRRTLVGMLISVELMLNGAGLAIVAAAQLTPGSDVLGQLAALLVMGLAAAEACLVLAIIIVVQRRFASVETDELTTLKG